MPPTCTTRPVWLLALALAATMSSAQSGQTAITPSNFTVQNEPAYGNISVEIAVSHNDSMVPTAQVLPLTNAAANEIPPTGISGPVFLANASNMLNLKYNDIAYISCEPSAYSGNIDAVNVFQQAESRNVSAIVFYSGTSDYCALSGATGTFTWIYSMKYANSSQSILNDINGLEKDQPYYATIGPPDVIQQLDNGSASGGSGSNNDGGNSPNGPTPLSNTNPNGGQNPLGPSPSTAVAMIILYSITGVITALFLIIIITGAVRAHRHPERYGPRNILGRPRQSRARGLARAMLDGLPIVKFGDQEEAKPTDVELQDAENGRVGLAADEVNGEPGAPDVLASGACEVPTGEAALQDSTTSGIGEATDLEPKPAAAKDENQGCSICTDDFEIGQDLRVLPCNHRFHPACIDPWLLNVSGTCPLCRIDLRPQTSRTSEGGELDEHGNPITRDGEEVDGLAAPLGWETSNINRSSVRRSLLLSVMGLGRPVEATREERVQALRRLRLQQAAHRRAVERVSALAQTSPAQEEPGIRSRLRERFNIRTRRRGPAGEREVTEATGSGTTGDEGSTPGTSSAQ